MGSVPGEEELGAGHLGKNLRGTQGAADCRTVA